MFMKRFFLFVLIFFFLNNSSFGQLLLKEGNIDRIVKSMTLEEKARMVVGIGTFWKGDVSLRNWRDVAGIPGGTFDIPRLGIPCIYFGDGPLGIKLNEKRMLDSHRYYSTSEPVPLLLASSWNPDIVYSIAQDIGEECREYGIDVLLGPSINIIRNPLCGRNHEYYSEDPFLAGIMSEAFINGVQSVNVGATVKHFAVNNQESNKIGNNAIVSQRALREIYLKPFEMSVSANPWAFMTSYNGINGTPASYNPDLISKILRNDWEYEGMVLTDWGGGYHPIQQLKAGNNLQQPGTEDDVIEIIKAVKEKRLSENILNENVERVLEMIVKTNTFKRYKFSNSTDLQAHEKLARQAGAESAILLKNINHTLPFIGSERNIAIYGRTGYYMIAGGIGAFEYNGPNRCVSLAEGFRKAGYNVDFQLSKRYYLLGPNQLLANWLLSSKNQPDTDEVVVNPSDLKKEASRNDVAIVVLGHVSSEGADRPRSEFYFTDNEKHLVKDVSTYYHQMGKKVILVLNIPAQMELESIKNFPDAIICAYQGGEEIGNWLVDLMAGKITPSGKLTITFAKDLGDYPSSNNFPILNERYEITGMMKEISTMKTSNDLNARKNLDYTLYEEGIYVGYRYFDTHGKNVTYPFGYGLSYTTFKYNDASIKKEDDNFIISLNVTNTGKYKGKEIVELYVTAPNVKMDKPKKELKAFYKTQTLKPGETEKVTMIVPIKNLASFDEKHSMWVVDKGTYKFHVSSNINDVKAVLYGKVDSIIVKKVSNALPPNISKEVKASQRCLPIIILIIISIIIISVLVLILFKLKANICEPKN